MQTDVFIIVFLIFVPFYLMVHFLYDHFQIKQRLNCRHNKHMFKDIKGKNQYKCIHCKKPKSHPHLQIIDGGKKVFENKFKW